MRQHYDLREPPTSQTHVGIVSPNKPQRQATNFCGDFFSQATLATPRILAMWPNRTVPVVLVLLSAAVAAEESVVSPKDIAREVREADAYGGLKQFDFIEGWTEARRKLDERTGLSWSAGYYSAAVAAIGGNGVPFGASGELNFQGVWAPGKRWTEHPTELRFRLRHRHAYGGTAASELGTEIGALWGVVNGFSDAGFEIPDFFLRHDFKRIGLELRYGQLSIDSQFGGHQLSSSRTFFLNQAFSSHPAVAFPRFGAGLTAMQRFDNGLSIGIGTTTVQGTQNAAQVDLEFGSDDLFQNLQVAYEFKDHHQLKHRIALMGWHSDAIEDAGQPDGKGVQITYERALDDDGTLFFSNLAWADGGATPVDYFLSGGVGRPCREKDFAGLAAGIGRGSEPGKPLQGVIEGFYRWQATENIQVSPDLQLIIGQDLDTGPGVRLIAGLRVTGQF